jgi:uncharacterized membrane protein
MCPCTGYIQHIDVSALGLIAETHKIRIYVEVVPGSFVHQGTPLAHSVEMNAGSIEAPAVIAEHIMATLTIGVRRTFEHDPRFGLSVLSEIASRALSPAVNDPGTAIDVIGRGVRTLTAWGKSRLPVREIEPACAQVYIRGLEVDDLFDDFFAPISRDGAALVEVNLRLSRPSSRSPQSPPTCSEASAPDKLIFCSSEQTSNWCYRRIKTDSSN